MQTIPPLEAMGTRIVIMGPTNAGKSTLCQALATKLGVPAIHLDRLRHLPGTDWQIRPDSEFQALHDQGIQQPAWVMDGNYSVLLPQRFARATGVIVVDDHLIWRCGRYLRRTLWQRERVGNLEGGKDSLKWLMVRWLWKTRGSAARYFQRAETTGLPAIFCRSLKETKALYRAWQLG